MYLSKYAVPHKGSIMSELLITRGSHFFKVTRISARANPIIISFAKQFIQYSVMRQGGRYARTAVKVFAAATGDRSEYRFHINTFTKFKQHLEANFLSLDLVEIIDLPIPEACKVNFEIMPHWKDKDYQVPVIEYLSNTNFTPIDKPPTPDTIPRAKFLNLRTGLGKSYSSMRTMQIIGERTVIVVKPKYIEKWVDDMRRTFVLDPSDIIVVRGSDQLKALLEVSQYSDFSAKVIIISNKTMYNYLDYYEKFGASMLDLGYGCVPEDLWKHLGAGIRLIDEVHEDFWLNYKISLYTNIKMSLSLSATLVADNDFLNRMYEIAYPAFLRYKGPAGNKYIDTTAVFYRLKYPNKIRYMDVSNKNYSHHVFEQSILRNKELTANYFGLIRRSIDGTYGANYKEGHKCLIFCISIDMCTKLTEYLRSIYTDKDVRRYVEGDPWENLMEAEICISSLQKAGTGVDIDKLSTAILTIAVSSTQSNLQSFGRLREMKDDTNPNFVYFVCEDIRKHIEYHERKRVMLDDRMHKYNSISISNLL